MLQTRKKSDSQIILLHLLDITVVVKPHFVSVQVGVELHNTAFQSIHPEGGFALQRMDVDLHN